MKKLTAIFLAALLVLSLTACGNGGGGGKDPIIGEWDLFALTDLNDTSSSTAVPSGSGSITFNDDGSFTLVIDTDSYSGTWEQDADLTENLDDATGYALDFDNLPSGNASLTEISGEDTVLVIVSGIDYGMSFQK